MTLRPVLRSLALWTAVALAGGCGGGSAATAPSSSTIKNLTITGSNTFSAIGQKATLTAVGDKPDFTTTIVTALATWQSSNPGIVTVVGGAATAVSAGSAVVTASYQGLVASLPVSVVPQADCSPYDASNWQITEETGGFVLTESFAGGTARVKVFDTKTDANNGLAVYQRFSTRCYVGRSNSRSNRSAYVFPYWTDPTGRATTVQPEDCEPYIPTTLTVANAGAPGWTLNAGSRQLILLDTAEDAATMLAVAQRFSNQCFIGRGNARSIPQDYVLPYWK